MASSERNMMIQPKTIQTTWDVHQNEGENHHSEQWRAMTEMEAGSMQARLHCACHSCDWPSSPPPCGVLKGEHQRERARGALGGGWARRTGVEAAVGVPSPPPGDYTRHDWTRRKVTHGAATHAQGDHHLVLGYSGSWLARARAPHAARAWRTHPL